MAYGYYDSDDDYFNYDDDDYLFGGGYGGDALGFESALVAAALAGRAAKEKEKKDSPPPPGVDGGYELQFISEVPDTLQCLICTYTARDPHQINCCGKIFCNSCLTKLKGSGNRACPNCRDRSWTSFPDKKSELYTAASGLYTGFITFNFPFLKQVLWLFIFAE